MGNILQSGTVCTICYNLVHSAKIWNALEINLVQFGKIWYNLGQSGCQSIAILVNLVQSGKSRYNLAQSSIFWYILVHFGTIWDAPDTNLVQFSTHWYNLG